MTIKIDSKFNVGKFVLDNYLNADRFNNCFSVDPLIAKDLARVCGTLVNESYFSEIIEDTFNEWLDDECESSEVCELELANDLRRVFSDTCEDLMDATLVRFSKWYESDAKYLYVAKLVRALKNDLDMDVVYEKYSKPHMNFDIDCIDYALSSLIRALENYDATEEWDHYLMCEFDINIKELFTLDRNLIGYIPMVDDSFKFDDATLDNFVFQTLCHFMDNMPY